MGYNSKPDEEFNLEMMEKETELMLRLRYLNKDNAVFTETKGGFLSLKIEDEEYKRVSIYAAFPFADPEKYISVREPDEKAKEIGLILDLKKDVDEATADAIRKQLGLRYFTPIITKIYSIKDKRGFAYWDVETKEGRCKFIVRMNSNNVVYITDTRLLITDLENNRFEITDYTKLSPKELKVLDLFL